LQPYTFEKPKCLVPIQGKTLLDIQCRFFLLDYVKTPAKNLIVVTGYLHKKIEKSLKVKHVKYIVNKDFDTTSCGYSMVQGLKETKNDVIYFNSDLLFDKYLPKKLIESNHDNCVCIKPADAKFKLGERGYMKDSVIEYIGIGNVCPYNIRVVGPTLLSKKGVKNLISLYEKLTKEEKESIHCLPLLGKFAEEHELYGVEVDDSAVMEINTNRDWKIASLMWSEFE